jgi:hypothetical protein
VKKPLALDNPRVRTSREPLLPLHDLPQGVTEITVTRPGKPPFIVHSRRSIDDLLRIAQERFGS